MSSVPNSFESSPMSSPLGFFSTGASFAVRLWGEGEDPFEVVLLVAVSLREPNRLLSKLSTSTLAGEFGFKSVPELSACNVRHYEMNPLT